MLSVAATPSSVTSKGKTFIFLRHFETIHFIETKISNTQYKLITGLFIFHGPPNLFGNRSNRSGNSKQTEINHFNKYQSKQIQSKNKKKTQFTFSF